MGHGRSLAKANWVVATEKPSHPPAIDVPAVNQKAPTERGPTIVLAGGCRPVVAYLPAQDNNVNFQLKEEICANTIDLEE